MKTAIIGSGIGGLMTALLLEKEGFKVTVYEKQSYIGGRLAYQSNGYYKIDQGPTIILLPELLKSLLAEAGVDPDSLELIPCEPMYDIHYPDGSAFTKYRDLPRQLEELERRFPGESVHFLKYLTDMSQVFEIGMAEFLSKAFHRKRDFLSLENVRLLIKSKAYQNVKKYISTYFKDPDLQDAYALQSLYIGGSPEEASALYGLVSYSEHAHGIWYLKGGYAGLIDVLEKACLERGIRIETNSPAERILTEGGRVSGVTVNGREEHFEAVIYNGDLPNLPGLLKKDAKRPKRYKPSSGCVLAYIGADRRFDDANMHQFFMSSSFDRHMSQVFKTKEVPDDPSFYVFNPAALDETAAPPGESVLYILIPVPSGDHIDWAREKERLVDRVISRAEERLFSGLREHIKWLDIRTPAESAADGLYQGGSFGIAPTFTQSGGFRPQSVQSVPYDIERLYAVGASIHPGGGVPIVMQGAKLLRDHIVKELETSGSIVNG